METHVLVPLDDSEPAWDALEHVVEHTTADRLTVIHVIDPNEVVYWSAAGGYADTDGYDRAKEDGENRCAEARAYVEAATGGDVEIETVVETGRPARTIVEYATDHDVDHLVMGSHGRSGVSRILLGSVAETVVRRAPCPVTIVR